MAHNMEFVDPSRHIFPVPLTSKTFTLDSLGLPLVQIDISPNGNDRWIFDYKLSLAFDDGSVFTTSESGIVLDQDNKHHTGVFQ